MTTQKKDWKNMLVELENKMAEFFVKKLPSMPEKFKEVIVKYSPYLIVIMMILTVPTILAIMGVGIAASPLTMMSGYKYGFAFLISAVFGLLIIVLELMAIKGLFKRELKAWKLLFYISLLQALSSLIRFDLGGLIIGSGISWYILFQIKSYYK